MMMNNELNRDQIALDAATAILPMYFEAIPGVQLKAKIQIAVRDAINLAAPAQGALTDALPVDIYGRPVAWRVHLRAKGEAPTVDYDQPALFKVERSAISWMHEQIDFKGWRNAWMEPLFLRPAPANRGQVSDAADAARYRFLRYQMCFTTEPKQAPTMAWGGVPAPEHDPHRDWMGDRFTTSVDRTVDAAIQDQAGDEQSGEARDA